MKRIDLVLHNIKEIFYIEKAEPITIRNFPENPILTNHSIVINEGRIIDILPSTQTFKKYKARKIIKCEDYVVTPGLVDAHTHLVFAGSREDEWEQKILGKSYMEIAKEGGGIIKTVKATRNASFFELLTSLKSFIQNCIKNGTTAIEIKSGYGLDFRNEIKILNVIKKVKNTEFIEITPTLLAAHAIPPEYKNDRSAYITLIEEKIIPYCAKKNLAEFCDIFVEEGFFTQQEAERILQTAKQYGLKLKMHIDEFSRSNSVELALKLNVKSVEHLAKTSLSDIQKLANSNVFCVLLPTTYFGTTHEIFNYGKVFWNKGAKVALGTDANPGTSMCFSMQEVIRLATILYKVPIYVSLAWATINSAFAIGKEDKCGQIAKGKVANLVIWHAPSIKYIFYTSGLHLLKYTIVKKKIVTF